jgi:hypothetical protein
MKVAHVFRNHSSGVKFHVARFDVLDAINLNSDVMQSTSIIGSRKKAVG